MGLWSLLRRGLLAGALAGLVAGLFAFVVAEPHVQAAIDHEERIAALAPAAPVADDGHAHSHDVEVSRPAQRGGMILATTLTGLAFGGLLALAYGVRRTRRPSERPWPVALAMGGSALFAFVALPLVLYPANPPGVGDPDTINTRTLAYLAMTLGGLIACWGAAHAARAADRPGEPWRAWLASAATLVAAGVLMVVLLPGAEPAPQSFPAQLLWEFRVSAAATQVVLWTVLTLGFATVVARASHGGGARVAPPS